MWLDVSMFIVGFFKIFTMLISIRNLLGEVSAILNYQIPWAWNTLGCRPGQGKRNVHWEIARCSSGTTLNCPPTDETLEEIVWKGPGGGLLGPKEPWRARRRLAEGNCRRPTGVGGWPWPGNFGSRKTESFCLNSQMPSIRSRLCGDAETTVLVPVGPRLFSTWVW